MKSMKKSMFVTTILMVVLLIVALSTATFAWYTANSSVGANVTTVTSASSSTASLVVDKTVAANNMANNSTVTLTMNSSRGSAQTIPPMVLNLGAAPTSSITYSTFKSSFVTFTLDNNNKYTAAESSATPDYIYQVTNEVPATNAQEYFVLTNTGGVNADLTATVTIYASVPVEKVVDDDATGLFTDPEMTTSAADAGKVSAGKLTEAGTYYTASGANNFLRVALFVDHNYCQTWALNDTYKAVQYYNYTSTHAVAQTTKYTHSSYNAITSGTQQAIASDVAPLGDGVIIEVVAWFEGDNLTNDYAGTTARFKIDFGASNHPAA